MSEKIIMVKVDQEIHKKIKVLAKNDKRSMGNYIAKIVEDRIKRLTKDELR